MHKLPTKALSVKQPFASFMFLPDPFRKDVENRVMRTNYRGRIFIQASAQFFFPDMAKWDGPNNPVQRHYEAMLKGCELPDLRLETRSALIGTVEIVDCVRAHTSQWAIHGPTPDKPDFWHWVLADAELLPEPIPCPGMLGIWNVPERLLL